jgi:allantoicase
MDFAELPDLAAARLGGRALFANDEFFASRQNLLKPGRGVFIPGKFTPRGKWMDGWETRRRRTPGHDWCVVKLGLRGRIRGVDVDTNHFAGNQPEGCSIDACHLPGATTPAALRDAAWVLVLPQRPLGPGARHLFEINEDRPFTHVRLNIYPDGGIARLRVHGEVEVDYSRAKGSLDLAALAWGGIVLGASDQHFGRGENLLMPGRARNMGDGWETRRRRGPGHDWAVVRLGTAGRLDRVEIDTHHFKGNFPESASLEGVSAPQAGLEDLLTAGHEWSVVVPRTKLSADKRHVFKRLADRGPFTHVRLAIFPDGGVSRLRIHGRPAAR